MQAIPTKLFKSIRNRIFDIFREEPAWAELTSASGVTIYCLLALGGWLIGGKPLEAWQLLKLTNELLDSVGLEEYVWLIISAGGALVQFVGIFTGIRFFRATGACGMVLWHFIVVMMAWPIFPWNPMLAFPIALIVPNFFAIARHAKDWE